jgi:hypothetical protein
MKWRLEECYVIYWRLRSRYAPLRLAVEILVTLGAAVLFSYLIMQSHG